MRDRRAEDRKNAVTGGLYDVAIVAMHRIDHEFKRGIDDRARLFRVDVLNQIHRTLDIGKQRRHRFPLTDRDRIRFRRPRYL